MTRAKSVEMHPCGLSLRESLRSRDKRGERAHDLGASRNVSDLHSLTDFGLPPLNMRESPSLCNHRHAPSAIRTTSVRVHLPPPNMRESPSLCNRPHTIPTHPQQSAQPPPAPTCRHRTCANRRACTTARTPSPRTLSDPHSLTGLDLPPLNMRESPSLCNRPHTTPTHPQRSAQPPPAPACRHRTCANRRARATARTPPPRTLSDPHNFRRHPPRSTEPA